MAEPSPFEPRGDFIGGHFALPAHAEGEIVLEDPGDTSERRSSFPFASGSVGAAVDAARRAYPRWRDLAFEERAELLMRFGQRLEREAETLARTIALEVGKPLWEARTEVTAMRAKIEITLGEGMEPVRERCFETAPGQLARWRAHAQGVMAVLGPFNFPGHLPHGHVVPALALGNTVVMKPSERTPAVGQLYAALAADAGFPPGVFNLIHGEGTQGAALAAHRGVDGVLFTGSYAVGRRILEATLDQPGKLVVLEMGGKNGVLVCADANLDAAASAIAFGAAVTTGQRCSATSRVIVERAVAAPLAERLARIFRQIAIGHALDEGVFMGPLISAASRRRHADVLRWAAEEGAERLVDGGPCEGPRPGHYVRPTLHLARGLRATPYQTEEHFLPDVVLIEVDSFEEGLAALDATAYGLVGSVFSAERARFERAFRETRLGLLNWNASTVGASSRLPFGGVKKSGNERPAGVVSSLYCSYPVASLEVEQPRPATGFPGFPAVP